MMSEAILSFLVDVRLNQNENGHSSNSNKKAQSSLMCRMHSTLTKPLNGVLTVF